jgi:hypothetical protein
MPLVTRDRHLAVEQLRLEILGPRRAFPLGDRGLVADGAHDEEAIADREGYSERLFHRLA